jgi:hypothetical protein
VGVPKMYTFFININSGAIDTTTPVASAAGPNNENFTALQALGWSVTATASTVTFTRGTLLRNAYPAVNPMSHGINGVNVLASHPYQTTTITTTVFETIDGSNNFQTLTFYNLVQAQAGYPSGTGVFLILKFALYTPGA